jgi:autotransporter-associated beta strand protein
MASHVILTTTTNPMNKQQNLMARGTTLLPRLFSISFIARILPVFISLLTIRTSHADTYSWSAHPPTSIWSNSNNWVPTGTPNGPNDVATFGVTDFRDILVSNFVEVNGITFNSGASSYTISPAGGQLTLSGTGISNNSGIAQNFGSPIIFKNSAAAGNATFIDNAGTILEFQNSSNAGNAIANNAGDTGSVQGGQVDFKDNASAGSATITSAGGLASPTFNPAGTFFLNNSSAGNATLIGNGSTVDGARGGGAAAFLESSDAGSATIIANGGANGGGGGGIAFAAASTGGTSRIEVFGNGYIDISSRNAPSLIIGSLEGTGNGFLGANNLIIGSRNSSTLFSGALHDGNSSGSGGTGGALTKIGSGTLTLSGSSVYTGPTTINAGKLRIDGSITSDVTVNDGGTLGGSGTTGTVIVNHGGTVAPGDPQTLTVNGDYQQNNGTLRLAIAGTSAGSFDRLIVTGGVTLTGTATLELDFINGFAPHTGDTFDLVTAASFTGSFTVQIEGLAPGFQYTLTPDGSGNLQLTALNDGVPVGPTPTPTPTPAATPTPSSTPSPTPTAAPSSTPSATPVPGVGHLANISTRLRVETGDNALIGGFIVTGTQPKKVILRAIGPSLAGVPGALTNPILELHGQDGFATVTNDNWMDAPNRQEIIDSTIAPTSDFESAILMPLPANNSAYTAIVRGVGNGTGVGLVEAYDLDSAVDSKLANISTRGLVQTADNVMIGGFIVVGQTSTKVIVRAIGPSLAVPGKLADPNLELRDGNGTLIQENNNWRTGGQEAEIIATGIPPSDDLESAIIRLLDPGAHTVIVRGQGDATGVALVEVYDLGPP